MKVINSGDRAIALSGYNSTISNITVEGNGCGGIGLSGGDQVCVSTYRTAGKFGGS